MRLCVDFEPTWAALLSRSPLPSLDAAIKELISKENRRPHHHLSSSDVVLTTPRPSASFSGRPRHICKYCQNPGHDISECFCKQKDDKRKQHQSRGILPRPQAASGSSTPINNPVVTSPNLRVYFIDICLNLSLPSQSPQVTNLGFSTQLAVITWLLMFLIFLKRHL